MPGSLALPETEEEDQPITGGGFTAGVVGQAAGVVLMHGRGEEADGKFGCIS
jgi:hypothetical protein